MLAKEIIAEEAEYHKNWTKSGFLTAADYGGVHIFDYRSKAKDYSFSEVNSKTLLVLHHTAGYLWGDVSTLTTAHLHVSVAFVISRTGIVYRLFDDTHWSNHLGKNKDVVGDSIAHHKRSVAIEMSNVGPLVPNSSNSALFFAGSKYCDMADAEYYTKLPADFRGFRYFASFTDAQYAVLRPLIDAICAKHTGIPRTFIAEKHRYSVFSKDIDADKYKGIASHVNYRRTGKTDIGPAFDWAKIT